MARYEESLRMFGGARFIISSLSSKSLSVGCLLAAFEKRTRGDKSRVRVGMAHIETRRYEAAKLVSDAPFLQPTASIIPTSLLGSPTNVSLTPSRSPLGYLIRA